MTVRPACERRQHCLYRADLHQGIIRSSMGRTPAGAKSERIPIYANDAEILERSGMLLASILLCDASQHACRCRWRTSYDTLSS